MSNREDTFDALVERAFLYRTDTLAEVIEKEALTEYELGHVDIVEADDVNFAIVPCEDLMIMAREHYDYDSKKIAAEYAIYTQHDHDGNNSWNSLNMNATYHFEYVCPDSFESMAEAIATAYHSIKSGEVFDDPREIVMEFTEPYEHITISDAERIIAEARENGYLIPSTFTARDFLAVYDDMEPEEEE